jgi:hypothetical protein
MGSVMGGLQVNGRDLDHDNRPVNYVIRRTGTTKWGTRRYLSMDKLRAVEGEGMTPQVG